MEWEEYLAGLSEEEAKCAVLRVVLVELNLKRLSKPDGKVLAALLGITDVDRLARMNVLALKASSWQEVLQTPSTWEEMWQVYDGKPPGRNMPALS